MSKHYTVRDFCDGRGAQALCDTLRAYWRERGYEVEFRTNAEGYTSTVRSRRVDVRSNLVNGLPPGWTGRRPPLGTH